MTDFGNNFATHQLFVVTAGTDTTPPVVTSVTPLNNSTNSRLEYHRCWTFGCSIKVPSTTAHSTCLTVRIPFESERQSLFKLRSCDHVGRATMVVTNGVTDLAGNALANFSSTFTTN